MTSSGSDSEPEQYTLMRYNFALFFGLVIQMYEATLVADDSPYDLFLDGDASAISSQAQLGVDLFRSQTHSRCINCHEGAELTGASVRRASLCTPPASELQRRLFKKVLPHGPASGGPATGGQAPFRSVAVPVR